MKHIVKRHEINGLGIVESVYPPNLKQPRHTHALASFSFVLEGSYVEDYGTRQRTRRSSTVVFHPPQESHAVDFQNKAVRILSVQLDFKRLAHIREHSIALDCSGSWRSGRMAWLGRRLYLEFRRMDRSSALAIEGLVFEILAEASRARAISERDCPLWLQRAQDFLHDNFSESFVFEDVAKIAGVHPVHLARVFREANGCTIGEYLRRMRVEFACKQISTTEIPLGEIALAAGFADQSHLTKIFKTYFGLTPSEYRRLLRKR